MKKQDDTLKNQIVPFKMTRKNKRSYERLKRSFKRAEAFLKNEKKMQKFLIRLENKLRKIPLIGDKLAYAPIFAELLNNYLHKTYTEIPMGSLISIVASLIYLVAPIDAISDFLGALGYVDDAGVIGICILLVKSDLDEYIQWREISSTEDLNGNSYVTTEVEYTEVKD